MCEACWRNSGAPTIFSEKIGRLASGIRALKKRNPDLEWIHVDDRPLSYDEMTFWRFDPLMIPVLMLLNALPNEDRASAIGLAMGLWGEGSTYSDYDIDKDEKNEH